MKFIFQIIFMLMAYSCLAQAAGEKKNTPEIKGGGDSIRLLKKNIGNNIPKMPLSEKMEQADYNCDETPDYRIKSSSDTSKWDYYLFDKNTNTFRLDTFLSSTNRTLINSIKPFFIYYKEYKINSLTNQTDVFICTNGGYKLVKRTICSQPYHFAERIDCDFYEANEKGELILIEYRQGEE